MVKVLKSETFSKEIRKHLQKHKVYFRDVYVKYNIDNENYNGNITIKVIDVNDVESEISTPIKLTDRLFSHGKPVHKIMFGVRPTDMVFDIITKDHYLEPWQNAYRNQLQVIEDGKAKDCLYHISMIDFHNEKRNKSTRVQEICFDGYEVIKTL